MTFFCDLQQLISSLDVRTSQRIVIFDQCVRSLILKSVQKKIFISCENSLSLSELFHSHSFQRKIILFTCGRLVLNCKTETRKRFTKLSGKQPIGAVSLEPSSTKFYKLI